MQEKYLQTLWLVARHKDKIIGEGYHKQYGGKHAEVNAIESVKDHTLLKELFYM